jgi:hypothetical protein
MKVPVLVVASAFALTAIPAARAQVPPPVSIPEPARLAEARKLIALVMPADERDAMIATMMNAMMANFMKGVTENPDFEAAVEKAPGAREVFGRFMEREQQQGIAVLRERMPGLVEAMARAYARRFTVAQMIEIETFVSSPTGRLYVSQSAEIMADPDVAAWQTDLARQEMARMPEEIERLKSEIDALQTQGSKSDGN